MKHRIGGSQILTRKLLQLQEEFARMQSDATALHPGAGTQKERSDGTPEASIDAAGTAAGEVSPAAPGPNQDSNS